MSLLIPLGLLGLLGLVALLLIYILKPNFQQKVVSSTYVWKLSLKYKKKRLPISRLRNLLILLCQILIIVCSALILSKPAVITSSADTASGKILVIDASADMLTENDQYETRFERALSLAKSEAESAFDNDGYVSVILAGTEAEIVVQQADKSEQDDVYYALDSLECTYGIGDVDGAMNLAETILSANPEAEVVFFTGTAYSNEEQVNVRVVHVTLDEEWNVAILGAKAELVDNYYEFTIEIACYGGDNRDIAAHIRCSLKNVNGKDDTVWLPSAEVGLENGVACTLVYSLNAGAYLSGDSTQYIALDDSEKIYSFTEMYVYVEESDSFPYDDEYYVYGTTRPTIKVEYFTSATNPFYSTILKTLQESLKAVYDIQIKEIRSGSPEIEGYDFYIFEGTMPEKLPSDGVILMAYPDTDSGAGFKVGQKISIKNYEGDGASLARGADHPIMDNITNEIFDMFKLTEYIEIKETSLVDGYTVLMYYQGNPVFFVRDEADVKIAVVAFSTKNSNFNIAFGFTMLMGNLFDYFFPTTFGLEETASGSRYVNSVYETYDTVDFTARGTNLTVTVNGEILETQETEDGTAELYLDKYGTYTVTQTLISGKELEEKFYVTIPSSESNIAKTEDILANPNTVKEDKFTFDDLLVYFAAALVALLFIEWLLQTREGM